MMDTTMTRHADIAVSVVGVSKKYTLYERPGDRLKELVLPGRSYHTDFWALREITLEIPRGQTVGIIGANGSGKSTLLQVLAGVLRPTTGSTAINGRVAALLELGAGFNPEFTGRENALLNGALLGLREAEVRARLPQIIDFAEIGDFIDRPVKTYSSGMYVRLAFAIAVNVEPDVLIVDEALAVGDAYFQHRCIKRMQEFQAQGKTILFVSHDTAAVKALCDRAILLDQGQLVADESAENVVARYFSLVEGRESQQSMGSSDTADSRATIPVEQSDADDAVERQIPHSDGRYGSGAARILGLACYNEHGQRSDELEAGDPLIVRISVYFHQSVTKPNIGFVLKDRLGTDLASTNCLLDGAPLPAANPGTTYTVEFRMALPRLHPGHYAISPAVVDGNLANYRVCDWIENARVVHISGRYDTGSVMHPAVTIALRSRRCEEQPTEVEVHD